MGLPLQSFSSIHELYLGPIHRRLEAFLGLLVKSKMNTKLTVVMCCQILVRKSVAPSSGDFRQRPAPRYSCGQDQEFWRKSFSKIIITPLPRPKAGPPRVCNLNDFSRASCFLLLGGGVPNWKSHSDFFVFNFFFFFLKHHGDLWSTGTSFV